MSYKIKVELISVYIIYILLLLFLYSFIIDRIGSSNCH